MTCLQKVGDVLIITEFSGVFVTIPTLGRANDRERMGHLSYKDLTADNHFDSTFIGLEKGPAVRGVRGVRGW